MRLSEKNIFQTLMVHHNFPSSNHHLLGITVYSIFRQTEMGVGQNLLLSILMGWTSIYQLFWGSLGARVLTNSQMVWFFNHSFFVASSHFQLNLCPWRGSFFSRPRATACRDTCSLPRRRGSRAFPAWECELRKIIQNPKEIQDFCVENLSSWPGEPLRCWWSWLSKVDSCLFGWVESIMQWFFLLMFPYHHCFHLPTQYFSAFCFSACLLLCFSFFASTLLCCFCFSAFLLFCFSVFLASLFCCFTCSAGLQVQPTTTWRTAPAAQNNKNSKYKRNNKNNKSNKSNKISNKKKNNYNGKGGTQPNLSMFSFFLALQNFTGFLTS